MKSSRKQTLEKRGWHIGSADDFLKLTPEESAYIDMKLALAELLRAYRLEKQWTQTFLAEKTGSSQSRVAKMEAGDPTVSVDLLIRSLLAAGVSRRELARAMESRRRRARS
ncbi:MAG: helix-turn-helix domain-containing protein [Lysobacterales bacterium]|nr:MAG: helix-turn-helix domain-containing protein [Xanthomonadales bacterium]